MKYLLCIVCVIVFSGSSSAAPIIFDMGASARGIALGGALSAIADDESAVFYNPAGLAFLNRTTIAAFYQRSFETIHHIALAGAGRGWGVQLIQIDTGPIESTNEFGNPSGEQTRYASYAGLVGVALGIENFSVGLRGKLSHDDFGTEWGIDAGALVRLGAVRAALITENLLGSSEVSVRLGTALVVQFSPRVRMTTAAEVSNLLSHPEIRVGLEISVNGVQMRVGYDGVALITGAGARWNSIRLDWAYRMHPQLPASPSVTVAYSF